MEFSIKRVTKIAELMAEEMREKLGEGVQVAEIEQGLRELAREVSGVGLQKMIEESEEKYGSRVTCTCGQEAEPTGKRGAMVWSVFGKVSYTRRYYLCAHCHRGQSPLDQRLGLQPGESTSGLASLLGILGVETSFEEASDLAERFLLFRVSDNTVRKHTEGYGQAQAQREQEWKRTAEDGTAFELREQSLGKRPGRIYASMDGAYVPLHGEWRELKTLCWYEVEAIHTSHPQNHHGSGKRNHLGAQVGEQRHLQARNMKYYCDIQEAEQFGRLLGASAIQQQVDAYDEIVFLGDGAVWIWNWHKSIFRMQFKSWIGTMPVNISHPLRKPPLEPTPRKLMNG